MQNGLSLSIFQRSCPRLESAGTPTPFLSHMVAARTWRGWPATTRSRMKPSTTWLSSALWSFSRSSFVWWLDSSSASPYLRACTCLWRAMELLSKRATSPCRCSWPCRKSSKLYGMLPVVACVYCELCRFHTFLFFYFFHCSVWYLWHLSMLDVLITFLACDCLSKSCFWFYFF